MNFGCSNPEAELSKKEINSLFSAYSAESSKFNISSIDEFNSKNGNWEESKILEKSLLKFCGPCLEFNKEYLAIKSGTPGYYYAIAEIVGVNTVYGDVNAEIFNHLPYLAFRTYYSHELRGAIGQNYYDSLSKANYLCEKIKNARSQKYFDEQTQNNFENEIFILAKARVKHLSKILEEISDNLWLSNSLLYGKYKNLRTLSECDEDSPSNTKKSIWQHRAECKDKANNEFKKNSQGNVSLLEAELLLTKKINDVITSNSCIIPKESKELMTNQLDSIREVIEGALTPSGSYSSSSSNINIKINEISSNKIKIERALN